MPRYWLAAVLLLGVLLPFGPAHSSFVPGALEPSSASRVAPSVATAFPPDTLRSTSTAGTPFIRSLPAQIGDAPVTRYTLHRGPSLSGVAGRSFTWIPHDAAPGTYDIKLHAHHPNAQPDTLVLQIELESP